MCILLRNADLYIKSLLNKHDILFEVQMLTDLGYNTILVAHSKLATLRIQIIIFIIPFFCHRYGHQ